jgi:starch synthase (maltosyl-transferring)
MRRPAAVVDDETARVRLTRSAHQRVVVEHVRPEIDGGRFPIKRTPGESVVVTADVFADGHDLLDGVLK